MNSKALRGNILRFLCKSYPNYVIDLDIIGVFYRDYRKKVIFQAMAYLNDRGYVEVKKTPHPLNRHESQLFYRCTANGMDILDGTLKDDGVLIEDDDSIMREGL